MQSVGTRLRDARIKKGYTLEDINARTRISLKNLNAIESDDLSKISSPFTYRSFVKQIAELVGVDQEALSADALAASSTMPEPLVPGQEAAIIVRPHQFQPVKPKRKLTWLYRAASITVVAGAISGYLFFRNGGIEAAKLPTTILPVSSEEGAGHNSEFSKPVPATDQAAALSVATADAAARINPPAISQKAPPVAADTRPVLPAATTAPSASPTPSSTPAAAPEPDSAAIHIELSAIESTWLSIVADGKTTYTGVLEATETKILDGKETARVRTGNAGGVNVIFNGRALGTLGRRGQSRTFVFTKNGYEVVQGAGMEMTHPGPSGE